MKKIYTGIFCMGLALAGTVSSCDVMDTEPFESYSEDLVWGSYDTAKAFVMQTYNNTIANFSGNSAGWEVLTPNGAYCDQVGIQLIRSLLKLESMLTQIMVLAVLVSNADVI